MTVSASAEDHDDITNTGTTDAARGDMALCLSDYTNNPLSHRWKVRAVWTKGAGCKGRNNEHL